MEAGGPSQRPGRPLEVDDDASPIISSKRACLIRSPTLPLEDERHQENANNNAEQEGQYHHQQQQQREREDESDSEGEDLQIIEQQEGSVIVNVTVVNAGIYDCGVCFLPLKPPIFQCDVGHVVSCTCRNQLAAEGRCYVCRNPIPGGYRRCHAMEQVVDSIRIPCPLATYGCKTKPAYHGSEAHALACVHKPCHCPGEGCDFVSYMTSLLNHIATTHGWPCNAESTPGSTFAVDLLDGLNIVTPVRTTADHLFVLSVMPEAFGHAVTVFCMHPHPAATAKLNLRYWRVASSSCLEHNLFSELACTDLISSGVPPDSDECFQLLLPRTVHGENEATIRITAVIQTISPSSGR